MALGEIVQTMPKVVGGGVVARPFNRGPDKLLVGHELTAEEIMSIPTVNRRALVEKGWIRVWPAHSDGAGGDGEIHVISAGFGKFDVIRGVKLAVGVDADEVRKLTGKRVGKAKQADAAAAEAAVAPAPQSDDDGPGLFSE